MFRWMCDDPRKKFVLSIEGEGDGSDAFVPGGGGTTTISEGEHQANGDGQQGNDSSGRSQQVPYERFSQVNREKQELAKQLEAYKKFGDISKPSPCTQFFGTSNLGC